MTLPIASRRGAIFLPIARRIAGMTATKCDNGITVKDPQLRFVDTFVRGGTANVCSAPTARSVRHYALPQKRRPGSGFAAAPRRPCKLNRRFVCCLPATWLGSAARRQTNPYLAFGRLALSAARLSTQPLPGLAKLRCDVQRLAPPARVIQTGDCGYWMYNGAPYPYVYVKPGQHWSSIAPAALPVLDLVFGFKVRLDICKLSERGASAPRGL